jgi:hypothetical protein
MKKFGKFLLVVLVSVLIMLIVVSLWRSTCPKDVKLQSGWQLVQINGVVPKGAVVIVSADSDAVLPNDSETNRATGYIYEGRVNFNQPMWMITKNPVWVFYPDKYEFLQKKDKFDLQCNEKLSSLVGKNVLVIDEYDVGHP